MPPDCTVDDFWHNAIDKKIVRGNSLPIKAVLVLGERGGGQPENIEGEYPESVAVAAGRDFAAYHAASTADVVAGLADRHGSFARD